MFQQPGAAKTRNATADAGFTLRHSAYERAQLGRTVMNWDQVKGNWKQFKGSAQTKWGKLTDDEMDQIDGNREQLEGKIQERYGVAREDAKEQVDAWFDEISK
jgi:uncharacterized protein YjbJ (UPF0337 family)